MRSVLIPVLLYPGDVYYKNSNKNPILESEMIRREASAESTLELAFRNFKGMPSRESCDALQCAIEEFYGVHNFWTRVVVGEETVR